MFQGSATDGTRRAAQSDTAPAAPDVVILTGFLGSGKTTLLKQLTAEAGPERVAIIVNELAEFGVDQRLLELGRDDVVLVGGCICCAMRDDLAESMRALLNKRARCEIAPFTTLVVETTGLADPGATINGLLNEASLAGAINSLTIATTLDAVHGAEQSNPPIEARRQLAAADLILLTKSSLARPAAIAAAQSLAAEHNPTAPLVDVDVVGVQPLLSRFTTRPSRFWSYDETAAHTAGVTSLRLTSDQPVRLEVLTAWLHELMAIYGARLLRVKGFATVIGMRDLIAIHGVCGAAYPLATLERRPGDPSGVELVLIGAQLPTAEMTQRFRSLVHTEE